MNEYETTNQIEVVVKLLNIYYLVQVIKIYAYNDHTFLPSVLAVRIMQLSVDFDIRLSELPFYVVCSIGFLANLMLLIALFKDPLNCFRNSATYLVANLAVSDLLLKIIFFLKHIQVSRRILLLDTLQDFAFYLSMDTVFSISFDRFLMITYPFKHCFLMSGDTIKRWIVFMWFISFVHPMKNIFTGNKNDRMVKLGFGLILILLTGLL